MLTIISITAIFIYVIIMFFYVCSETAENFEFHEGGFLGMGYTTNTNREPTTKDVRRALIWPILFIIYIVKTIIWFINDCLSFLLLIVGFHYGETRLYYYIDRKFG